MADATLGATYDVTIEDEAERAEVLAELTCTPQVSSVVTAEPEPVCFAVARGARVALPRFYGLARYGPAPSRLCEGAPLGPGVRFEGRLSEANRQAEVCAAVLGAWGAADPRRHGARITVPCGFGKTVVALHCVAARGRRALVVAPNTVLAEQWAERAAQFLPGARVVELKAALAAKSRHWLVPGAGPVPATVRASRRRTLGASDVGRRVAVRGDDVAVRCADPRVRVELAEGGRHYRLEADAPLPADAALEVTVSVSAPPPWEAADARADGSVLLRFARPCTRAQAARLAAEALGSEQAPVPYVLQRDAVAGADERQADVVVATVQLLSMSPPPPAALEGCGVLVVDEVHSMCARVFSRALRVAPCARLLALSATPERRDGLHDALPWLCGDEVIRIARAHERVEVQVCTYRPRAPGAAPPRELRFGGGQLRVADMITALCEDAERTRRIAREVAAARARGRCVLVLGERVAHLRAVAAEVARLTGAPVGVLCGDTPRGERAGEAARDVLVATYPMCRQGFDKPRLDTLVMATPVTALEQVVGRILRVHPDKQPPLVVDVVDPYSLFAGEARKRARQYAGWGYRTAARELAGDGAGTADNMGAPP